MMFFKHIIVFIVALVAVVRTTCEVHEYSREKIQEIYPGFGVDYVFYPDDNNNPVVRYLKADNISRLFGIDDIHMQRDVKFEFFSRDFTKGVRIRSKSDMRKYVDISKPTKFVTHGWQSGGNKDTCVLIKNGFLRRYDANVFIMDWSAVAGNIFYPVPMLATPKVGHHYATYLNYLIDEVGVNPDDIHLVGHSLGAHVSGFAGREIKKGKIGRITGLDPALPGFDIDMVSPGTLNQNDAKFVDVIHTCAGFLGYKSPLGHADFYPNGGGPPQPGCGILEFIEVCSHGRSWKIFASSLVHEKPYEAPRCSTLDELYKKKACAGNKTVIGDLTPTNTRGIFYADVLSEDLVFKDDYTV